LTDTLPSILMVSGDTGLAQGLENVFRHTLREFSRYWSHVDVCVPRSPGCREQTLEGNVHVHPCTRSKLAFPRFIREVGRQILAERPIHVVTAHSYPFFQNERGAARVARDAGAVYAVEVMHIVGHPRAANLGEWLRRVTARLWYRRVCAPADLVRVINSEEVPEFLCDRVGVPREKIVVRPCFYLDFSCFRPREGRDHPGRHILYSGRLAANKGLRELCEAVAEVRREQELTLTILGDGAERRRVETLVRQLGLEDCTTMHGHLPHTELGDAYRAADVLVMPSKNEGGPRVTLEAMACGTPVITTPVGIMRELIVDGENGLFCGFDTAGIVPVLRRLLADPALAARLSAAGPPAVAHFEYTAVIRDYAEAYRQAIRGAGTGQEPTAASIT
jgi:glycosyltransferase involved in cell wall biosynthesis